MHRTSAFLQAAAIAALVSSGTPAARAAGGGTVYVSGGGLASFDFFPGGTIFAPWSAWPCRW